MNHRAESRRTGVRSHTFLLRLLYVAVVALLVQCGGKPTPEITEGVDACANCNMIIDKANEACGYFLDGEFVPFDSPVCLVQKFDQDRRGASQPGAVYFADYETGRFVPADSTYFLLTDHIPTVMNGGVLCFADKSAAESRREYDDESITDWTGFRVAKGTPDRKIPVVVTPGGMEPGVITVDKGELIEWEFMGRDLETDERLSLKGYDEFGEVAVPASGAPVTRRMLASRPGSGFAFIRVIDGKPLGMVKVMGAHTVEEEE